MTNLWRCSVNNAKEITCILCPRGCTIVLSADGSYSGARCKRGTAWAEQERTCAMRTLCTSVAVVGGQEPLVSVRTDREIPLAQIPAVMQVIKHLNVQAPVCIGDEVALNPADTLCRIIATRCIEAHTLK